MVNCIAIQTKALSLDIYRQPFLFFMPDEKPMYRTLLGAVLSLVTILVMLAMGIVKIV